MPTGTVLTSMSGRLLPFKLQEYAYDVATKYDPSIRQSDPLRHLVNLQTLWHAACYLYEHMFSYKEAQHGTRYGPGKRQHRGDQRSG
jgi:hypothetical protein